MNILTEEVVTDAEAKDVIEGRAKEGELKYEQKNAVEVLRKFIKIDSKEVEKLKEELKKIEKLRDRQIVAIINFLPEDRDDLKVIFHKEYASFTPEEIDAILEIVKKT